MWLNLFVPSSQLTAYEPPPPCPDTPSCLTGASPSAWRAGEPIEWVTGPTLRANGGNVRPCGLQMAHRQPRRAGRSTVDGGQGSYPPPPPHASPPNAR